MAAAAAAAARAVGATTYTAAYIIYSNTNALSLEETFPSRMRRWPTPAGN